MHSWLSATRSPERVCRAHELSFVFKNFRSVYSKQDILLKEGRMNNYQIILETETWLNRDVPSELLFNQSYSIYLKDRNDCRWGCVLIAINGLQTSAAEVATELELLWVELKILHLLFVLWVCYRPPSSGRDFVEKLGDNLENVFATSQSSVIILTGDFNIPSINWMDCAVAPRCHNNS